MLLASGILLIIKESSENVVLDDLNISFVGLGGRGEAEKPYWVLRILLAYFQKKFVISSL